MADADALAAQLNAMATPGASPATVVQGNIVSWESGNVPPTVTINLAGDTTPIPDIQYLNSYTPNPGDVVQIIKQDGSLLVFGAIAVQYLSPSPLGISQGGTGQSSAQLAIDALAGSVAAGTYLRGNGTHDVMSAIQVADVPTLNQSTTGSSASCTGNAATATTATNSTKVGGITISGTPAVGNVPIATSTTAAGWAAPSDATVDGVTVTGTPATGKTIICTSSSAATWQTPSDATIDGVTVTGVPNSGDVITATGSTAATWQAPSGGGGGTFLTAAGNGNAGAVNSNGLVVSITVTVPSGVTARITVTWLSVAASGTSVGNNGTIQVQRGSGGPQVGAITLVTTATNGGFSGSSYVCYDSTAGTNQYRLNILSQGVGTFTMNAGTINVETSV